MVAYLRNKKLRAAIQWAFKASNKLQDARSMLEECDYTDQKDICAMPKQTLLVDICYFHPRRFDFDNLVASQKATIDIIADLLKPGCAKGHADSDKRFEWKISQAKASPKEYALLITLSKNE
jgi:hypothetical protein